MAACRPHNFITQDLKLQQRFPAMRVEGARARSVLGPNACAHPFGAAVEAEIVSTQSAAAAESCTHTVISRQDANLPPWYAPNSTALLQLDDEFVAHATKLAPCKRLPRGWEVSKLAEVFNRRIGGYMFWLFKSDYGWPVERQLFGVQEVLAKIFWDFPVLCDTPAAAARLAEAAHAGLSHHNLLTWINTRKP
jgi:hypothetical protein